MHLSQQQVELQSQSFIFNSTRVSGQTNVLLISSLLLLQRGEGESWTTGSECKRLKEERRKDEDGGGENSVQWLNQFF